MGCRPRARAMATVFQGPGSRCPPGQVVGQGQGLKELPPGGLRSPGARARAAGTSVTSSLFSIVLFLESHVHQLIDQRAGRVPKGRLGHVGVSFV